MLVAPVPLWSVKVGMWHFCSASKGGGNVPGNRMGFWCWVARKRTPNTHDKREQSHPSSWFSFMHSFVSCKLLGTYYVLGIALSLGIQCETGFIVKVYIIAQNNIITDKVAFFELVLCARQGCPRCPSFSSCKLMKYSFQKIVPQGNRAMTPNGR